MIDAAWTKGVAKRAAITGLLARRLRPLSPHGGPSMLVALTSDLNRSSSDELRSFFPKSHRKHDPPARRPPSLFPRSRALSRPAYHRRSAIQALCSESGDQEGEPPPIATSYSPPLRFAASPPLRLLVAVRCPYHHPSPSHCTDSLPFPRQSEAPRAHHGRPRRGSLEQFEQRLCEWCCRLDATEHPSANSDAGSQIVQV